MSKRFALALERAGPGYWSLFESLASRFLGDEFGELRTLATPQGDEGRDAMLWQPLDDSHLALQYSVAADWEAKVRGTVRRLASTHPDVRVLIYASPLEIGARADPLRQRLRGRLGVYLDIRDRAWFIERQETSPTTKDAAEEFTKVIADPYLADAGVIDRAGSPLSTHEARAALLYLVLQREDDGLDRGLTKLCFDALVRAAIRDTNPSNRLPRPAIHERVQGLLPTHSAEELQTYVDRALERLDKGPIRHYREQDEFCLSYEERQRLAEKVAALEAMDRQFEEESESHLRFVAQGLEVDLSLGDLDDLKARLRRVLERFLFERGEAFVESLSTGEAMQFVYEEIAEVAEHDLARHPDTTSVRGNVVPLVAFAIERTLLLPTEGVQQYLRAVADAYTLFAFLRETPNVQAAVTKLFSYGDVWVDTSAVLPLMAEQLLDPEERRETKLLRAALDSGVTFFITSGVVKEISAHLDLCTEAARYGGRWQHRTPFILASYLWSGRDIAGFRKWLEMFRGEVRSLDDLVIYLEEEHRMRVRNLQEEADRAPDDLRAHTREFWFEVHSQRRAGERMDPEVLRQLVTHDIENFLGTIQRREEREVGLPFGYSSWWLTLDKRALGAAQEIGARCGLTLHSPILSLDFLNQYLSVGPMRRQLNKSRERDLPLITDTSLLDAPPADLIEAAESAREDARDQPERVIRRRVRDHLEREKLKQGKIGRAGIEAIEYDIQMALEAAARRGSRPA